MAFAGIALQYNVARAWQYLVGWVYSPPHARSRSGSVCSSEVSPRRKGASGFRTSIDFLTQ
jgi:hypothetical protein